MDRRVVLAKPTCRAWTSRVVLAKPTCRAWTSRASSPIHVPSDSTLRKIGPRTEWWRYHSWLLAPDPRIAGPSRAPPLNNSPSVNEHSGKRDAPRLVLCPGEAILSVSTVKRLDSLSYTQHPLRFLHSINPPFLRFLRCFHCLLGSQRSLLISSNDSSLSPTVILFTFVTAHLPA